ncbi:MAG TPA: hypothetical protein VN257_01845 [Actinotalea sp.]|nr:hypothetical protein [Actinotalea sp.]
MELELTQRPVTGDPAVDEALATLEDLGPTGRDHVAVFDALHGALADRLVESHE